MGLRKRLRQEGVWGLVNEGNLSVRKGCGWRGKGVVFEIVQQFLWES